MEVISANIVGYYHYKPDFEVVNYGVKQECSKECVICKRTLYEPSYDTVSDNKNIFRETEIVIGKCGHLFHADCIGNWLKTSSDCPIDKIKWCPHHVADTTTRLVLDNKKYNNYQNKFKNKFNYSRKKAIQK